MFSFNVEDKILKEFLDNIGDADAFTISFPDGDEPDWTAKTFGSREVVSAFTQCGAVLDEKADPGTNATQPTSKAP